jgi:predicted  nucleic acid-binding Zn-ribbon protein
LEEEVQKVEVRPKDYSLDKVDHEVTLTNLSKLKKKTEEKIKSIISKEEINRLLGKSPKLIGKVRSVLDKIDDISVLEDGRVIHNYLRLSQPTPDYKKLKYKLRRRIKLK